MHNRWLLSFERGTITYHLIQTSKINGLWDNWLVPAVPNQTFTERSDRLHENFTKYFSMGVTMHINDDKLLLKPINVFKCRLDVTFVFTPLALIKVGGHDTEMQDFWLVQANTTRERQAVPAGTYSGKTPCTYCFYDRVFRPAKVIATCRVSHGFWRTTSKEAKTFRGGGGEEDRGSR